MRKIPLTCWIADVCQVYKLDSLDNCTGASPVYCQYYCIHDIAVRSYTIPQLIKAQIPIFVGIENARTRAKTKIGNSTKAKSQMADQAEQNKISAKVTPTCTTRYTYSLEHTQKSVFASFLGNLPGYLHPIIFARDYTPPLQEQQR